MQDTQEELCGAAGEGGPRHTAWQSQSRSCARNRSTCRWAILRWVAQASMCLQLKLLLLQWVNAM